MKIYSEELEGAEEFWSHTQLPLLQPNQIAKIQNKGENYARSVEEFPRWHNFLGLITFLFIFFLDFAALTYLPQLIANIFVVSFFHGFFMYGATVYLMHEGVGHRGIVRYQMFNGLEKKIWQALYVVCTQFCRFFFADPEYYRSVHPSHHAYLATPKDQAFTNFVFLPRFFRSLLPFAGTLDFNDYKIQDSGKWSRSKIFSTAMGSLYLAYSIFLLQKNFSPTASLVIAIFLAPWIGFVLDRFRETTEHHLMPQDIYSGTRDLGVNFWSMLIGGGPWGQPCHFSHHLAPNLPWYFQVALHFEVRKNLTTEQRKLYLPSESFPKLLYTLLRKNKEVIKNVEEKNNLSAVRVQDHALLKEVQILRDQTYAEIGKLADNNDPIENEDYHLYAFFLQEKIIGSIAVYIPRDNQKSFHFISNEIAARLSADQNHIEIGRLFLRKENRSIRNLVQTFRVVYRELRANKRKEIFVLTDTKSISLYKRLGFKETKFTQKKNQISGEQTLSILRGRYQHFGVYGLLQSPVKWVAFAKDVEKDLLSKKIITYSFFEHFLYGFYNLFTPLVRVFSRIPIARN